MNDFVQGTSKDITSQVLEHQTQEQERNTAYLSAQPWQRPVPGGPLGMLGPASPVLPMQPEDRPRTFEYRIGYNLSYIPRQGYGLVSFPALRNLGACCYEARLNIELIKREIRALEWEIAPEENQTDESGLIETQKFFTHPDGYLEFDQWVNALLEEILVIDAPCIYPNLDRGGNVSSLEVIQGDTIKPLLDFRGKIPTPPVPAWMQILYGIPRWSGARNELVYRPFNNVANNPYGTSPLEFFLLLVNLAVRRSTRQVMTFTQGNVPDALLGAPSNWSIDQIQQWQEYWDSLLSGKIAQQVALKMVPTTGAGGSLPVYEFVKDDMGNTNRDLWLMQVACWAFGNSPSEFGLTPGQGLGGKGFMENMENVQYRSMVGPISQYLEKLFTSIIHQYFKRQTIRFRWKWAEPKPDFLQQAQVDQIYITSGVYGPDYVQERDAIPLEFRKSAPEPTPPAMPFGKASASSDGMLGGASDESFFWDTLTKVSRITARTSPQQLAAERRFRAAMLKYFAELRQRIVREVTKEEGQPLAKDFEESEHPRGEGGKFEEKPGGEKERPAEITGKETEQKAKTSPNYARAKKVTKVFGKRTGKAPASEEQVERVASLMDKVDPKVVAGVKRIHVADTDTDFNRKAAGVFAHQRERGQQKTDVHNIAAYYDPIDKSIVLRPGYKDSTFYHEMGHQALQMSSKSTHWASAYTDPDFDRHTQYSRTNAAEGFSDAHSAYVSAGGVAKDKKTANTFRMVKAVLNGI